MLLNPKKLAGTAVLFLALTLSGPAVGENQSPGGALDLWQCYEKAIQQSETVAISEEGIKQAEEVYRQAWSGIPPRLSFTWQEKYQDPAHTDFRQALGAINLSLSALTGFREKAAMYSAKTLTRQKELETKWARQNILSDVAQAFWNVVEAENQIQVTKSQQALMQDRIKELEDRVRIGRSREAEVVAAQSLLAQLEANQEDLERVRLAARELLAFLTGAGRDVPLVDASPLPGQPRDLAFYLNAARQRPDLLALRESQQIVQAAVKLAKSGHYPSLSLEGNYYVVGPEVNDQQGETNEIRWDIKANLKVPLYSWGQVQSSVREANSQLFITELTLKRQERQVETDVKSAWENLRSSLSELDKYDKLVTLTDRNYKLQSADYRRGLVTNLDVIQALTGLYDATLRRDQSRLNAKLSVILLQVAAGEIPERGGNP
ncbi:MAG: TolC family protein [Proteobacteria bacterium]|nr:TolC family protein [Pseudomonadota bacterium]